MAFTQFFLIFSFLLISLSYFFSSSPNWFLRSFLISAPRTLCSPRASFFVIWNEVPLCGTDEMAYCLFRMRTDEWVCVCVPEHKYHFSYKNRLSVRICASLFVPPISVLAFGLGLSWAVDSCVSAPACGPFDCRTLFSIMHIVRAHQTNLSRAKGHLFGFHLA